VRRLLSHTNATCGNGAEYDETLTEEEKAIGRFQRQRLKKARKRMPHLSNHL
jgi:hypothetical protein